MKYHPHWSPPPEMPTIPKPYRTTARKILLSTAAGGDYRDLTFADWVLFDHTGITPGPVGNHRIPCGSGIIRVGTLARNRLIVMACLQADRKMQEQ